MLPSQPTRLIGRERELAELGQQLARSEVRLLTLTGPAGTGKTRLAIHLAAERGETFEHGSVFVDLAPVRDPALVVSALASGLGLLDVGSQPLIDTVTHFVRDRHLLVVLDNFEQVLEAAPLLADLLAASPRLSLLVTSRAALRLWRWEHEFPVAPLALPDPRHPRLPESLDNVPSVALFVERARARRPDFALGPHNASAVAEICVRLDGLPLALELAAAGIKLLSPQAILTRLQRRLDLIGEGGADFPRRHQTLRAAVGWSYDLLSAPERALLRRLAVFVGGFNLDVAEAMCAGDGMADGELLPLLARLVDQSLVVAEERGPDTRYRLLETIREYAGEQLNASGEAEFYRRRHADWGVRLGLQAEAELRGPQQSAWLDRLELDHDNLRAALDWLSAGDQAAVGLGLRLAAALWQFWWLRGYLSEGRQRLETLLARAGAAAGPSAERTAALLAVGVLAFRQGDYAAARAHLEESLVRARALGDRAAAAAALRNLGRMAIDRGEFGAAHRFLDESLGIERLLDSAFGTAWSLNYLGLLAHFEGDNAAGRALLEQSLPLLRAVDDRWGTAVALYYLGRVASDQADTATAAARWIESLGICRAQGYLWCVPYLLEGVAVLAVVHGRPVESARLAGAAQALHDTIGAPLPPVWRADLDRRLAPARRALGKVAFAAAWGEGRALSVDEAVAEASQAAAAAESAGRVPPTRPEQAARPPRPPASAAPLETRYARSGGVNIAYQVLGQGPIDLVFVMGWVTHLDYFWQEPRFARFLRRLASFSRLIVFDKRGTGLSDRGVGLPTLEQRMDDVRAVMDAVGSERAALLGVSEGGALCTLFAATHPDRTSALALVGCFPRALWAPDYPWGDTPDEREQRLEDTERGWGSLEWATRDLERRAPSVAHDEQFTRWWATYLRMSASPGAARAVRQMNNQIDVRPVLPAIGVPTLVVHRADDRTALVEEGRYLAAHIPGARYVELPGADHLPFAGDQDAVLDAIEEFLTGVRPAAEPDRVLATVLAMEVVDAAERAASMGERRWRQIEAARAALAREQLERHRGRAAGTAGSGFLATFDGPARGIRCASAIIDQSRALGVELRAGLHTGECDVLDGELGGTAFRIATGVMAHAGPGDVLVSSTIRDLVAGSGISFEEQETLVMTGGLGPWRLFRIGRGGPPRRSAGDGSTPAPPAATRRADPLTPREREVAVLLARGLTNRQIGDELVISAATAERHVVNIFNKLGFHSRSQLAAWVVERGLQKIHTPVQDR
jgi:predicted ATPase/pimeloyl-ACP methyl ester carboxylesterase/DNA-binding CsgD family transcriptional regulator